MSGYDVISQIFEFTIYKKDLDEISDEVKQVIDFISVKNFDEVLPIALVSRPIKKKEVKENLIVTDKTSKTNVVTQ